MPRGLSHVVLSVWSGPAGGPFRIFNPVCSRQKRASASRGYRLSEGLRAL
ncbi:hypothetical protein PT2222_30041 [Paraburkholderia tropica]